MSGGFMGDPTGFLYVSDPEFNGSTVNHVANLIKVYTSDPITIRQVGGFFGARVNDAQARMAVWRRDGALLAQSAAFNVSSQVQPGGQGGGATVVPYVADVPPVNLHPSDEVYVGVSWDPSRTIELVLGDWADWFSAADYWLGPKRYYTGQSSSWAGSALPSMTEVSGRIAALGAYYDPWTPPPFKVPPVVQGHPIAMDGMPYAIPDERDRGMCAQCGRRPRVKVRGERPDGRQHAWMSAYCAPRGCSLASTAGWQPVHVLEERNQP